MSLNRVYIVSLSSDQASNTALTWREIVEVRRNYFYPVPIRTGDRRGWPKKPENIEFLGFHNATDFLGVYPVISHRFVNPGDVPEYSGAFENNEPHYLFELGEPFLEGKPLGRFYPSGRRWSDLDILEKADTVADACNLTKAEYGELRV